MHPAALGPVASGLPSAADAALERAGVMMMETASVAEVTFAEPFASQAVFNLWAGCIVLITGIVAIGSYNDAVEDFGKKYKTIFDEKLAAKRAQRASWAAARAARGAVLPLTSVHASVGWRPIVVCACAPDHDSRAAPWLTNDARFASTDL